MFQSGPRPTRRALLRSAAALAASRLARAVPGAPALDRPGRRAPLAPRRATPGHFRFTLGDFAVTTISDAGAMLDGPWPIVGEDRPAAEVARLMHDNLLPETRFRPGFTPTLIDTGSQRIRSTPGTAPKASSPSPTAAGSRPRSGRPGSPWTRSTSWC
jgi:hypothetical protein